MDPRVLGDLVARERRSDAPALRAPALGREYDYRRLCTNAWKTGNFLRHLGVRSGDLVVVAADPAPEPVLALFGSALLGGVTRFVPLDGAEEVAARAAVLPRDRMDALALAEHAKRVVYGDDPDDPSVSYFERDVWSENPTEPPDEVAAEDAALRADAVPEGDGAGFEVDAGGLREYSHAQLLEAAGALVERWKLDGDDAVALRAPLTHPGTVVAGLAALAAGGCVVLGGETAADCAVATGDAPETRVLSPDDVV